MKIILNGSEHKLDAPVDVSNLLANEGFADKLVAVAVNGTFVPKEAHKETILNDGDKIEIVAPMQGG